MSTPDIINEGASFDVNFDSIFTWGASADGGTTPAIVRAKIQAFQPYDVQAKSAEQFQMLMWHFAMYQQYKIAAIDVEWVPRYETSNVAAQVGVYQWGGLAYEGTNPAVKADPIGASLAVQAFAEHTELWMLADNDDVVARDQNLEEFYRIRSDPRANGGPLIRRRSIRITPHIEDAIIDGGAQTQGGASLVTSSTNANNITFNTSLTMPMPWLATKVWRDSPAGQQTVNTRIRMFGLKTYVYTPFNTIGGEVGYNNYFDFDVGLFRYKYRFQFSKPDSRTISIASPTLTLEEGEILKNIYALRKLKGERVMLQEINSLPQLQSVNKRSQENIIETMGDTPAPSKKNKTGEQLLTEIKEIPSTGSNAPTQSSLQTPSAHPARTPLGLLGLRRSG